MIGGIFGSIAKTVVSSMADTIAQQAGDIDRLQNLVKDRLEGNDEVMNLLGSDLSLSPPLSQSSSSSNINGVVNKAMACMMQVEGSKGSGTLQVEAYSGADNLIQIKTLVIRLFNGKVLNIGNNDRGKRGSGGSSNKKDNYIDAEFFDKK